MKKIKPTRNELLYEEAAGRFEKFLNILDQCMLSNDTDRLLAQTRVEIGFLRRLREELEFDNSTDILYDFSKYTKPKFTRI